MLVEPERFDASERIQKIRSSHASTVQYLEYPALTITNRKREDLLTCKHSLIVTPLPNIHAASLDIYVGYKKLLLRLPLSIIIIRPRMLQHHLTLPAPRNQVYPRHYSSKSTHLS